MFHTDGEEEPLVSRRVISALIYAAGDYAAILAAEFVALFLRNFFMDYSTFRIEPMYFYFITPAVFMAFLAMHKLYTRKMLFYQLVEKIFHACLYGVAFAIILMFAGKVSVEVSRLFVGFFAGFVFLFLVAGRYALKRTLGKTGLMMTPVLILGAGLTADAVVREFEKDTGLNYKVLGFLEDGAPETECAKKYPILGGFADLEKVAHETGVRHILIAAPGLAQEELAELVYRAQSIASDVGIVPNLVAVPMSNVEAESYYDAKVMVLHVRNNLALPYNRLLKRIFDVVLTVVGGLLISPILLGIALWIKHEDPGPALFRHRRVGRNGKPFDCYKFRSMCVDSEERLAKLLATDPAAKEEWDRTFKLKNDPRITKAGAFLRKTSLDELPQLLNVLKGEMSLVGPRPIVEKEIPRYEEFIKEYYMVPPGITGMWQVSGRSDIDYPERVRMDSWYVHNWSIWLDMVLLYRTVAVVLRREGAY